MDGLLPSTIHYLKRLDEEQKWRYLHHLLAHDKSVATSPSSAVVKWLSNVQLLDGRFIQHAFGEVELCHDAGRVPD